MYFNRTARNNPEKKLFLNCFKSEFFMTDDVIMMSQFVAMTTKV